MAISTRLQAYLQEREVPYEVVAHPHSASSLETAELAHIPGTRIAKTVVLEDEQGYLAAVVPANAQVDLGELHRQLNRNLGLATEQELVNLFEDCELGAIPAMAMLYGMETVVDDSLAEQPEIYFEAGDHERLIRVSGEGFESLMGDVQHSYFIRTQH